MDRSHYTISNRCLQAIKIEEIIPEPWQNAPQRVWARSCWARSAAPAAPPLGRNVCFHRLQDRREGKKKGKEAERSENGPKKAELQDFQTVAVECQNPQRRSWKLAYRSERRPRSSAWRAGSCGRSGASGAASCTAIAAATEVPSGTRLALTSMPATPHTGNIYLPILKATIWPLTLVLCPLV